MENWIDMKNIQIREYKNFNFAEITDLYKSVGWTNYTNKPEMIKSAFENSLKILGAFDDKKLIGFVRAVGDGCSILYIQDIIVQPVYQRNGIGSELLRKMLELYSDVYQKILCTDDTEKTNNFYKSLGFIQISDINCKCFMYIK